MVVPSYYPKYSRQLDESIRRAIAVKGQTMTGNIDDVRPPRSMKNIVEEVADWVKAHRIPAMSRLREYASNFELYDDAVHAVWPELAKASPEAHLRVTVSIYYELAERWGFEPTIPDVVKGLKL